MRNLVRTVLPVSLIVACSVLQVGGCPIRSNGSRGGGGGGGVVSGGQSSGTASASSSGSTPVIFASGVLDPSFGGTGKITTPVGDSGAAAYALVQQPDGKIVAAGNAFVSTSFDFALVRYLPDGSLDPSFGSGGKVTTDMGGNNDIARGMVLQPDGKILLAGYSYVTGQNWNFSVARYNSNGSLDPSFNGNGKNTTDFSGGEDYGPALALQPDGKIIVAGSAQSGTSHPMGVVRYNTNGSLDTSFGNMGKVTTTLGTYNTIFAAAVQVDGKIIASGYFVTSGKTSIATVRYNANGSLDTSFGGTGIVTTSIGGTADWAQGLALQEDGKILLGGTASISAHDSFAVVRYGSDGSLDPSFGTGGKVTTTIGGSMDVGQAMTLQSDGKIVLVGRSRMGMLDDIAIVRYTTDGSLDSSFGTAGKLTTDIGTGNDSGDAVIVQADGKMVVAAGFNGSFILLRYQ